MTAATVGRALWLCELRPFALACRLVCRGFRVRRPAGWSYDRNGLTAVVLGVIAVITIPQALAFDLFFSHTGVARTVSAIAHVYAVTWSLALAYAVQTEPHVVADGYATFRFPLLQSVHVALSDIASTEAVQRRPRGMPRFGLGSAGIVINLRTPVPIRRPMVAPTTTRIFVAADDVPALQRALSQ